MKHKRVIRKLAAIAGAIGLSLIVLASPIASTPVHAAPPQDDVMPLADFIEYRYKIEGTHLYQRLYNYSTAEWIGEWEYIGEVQLKGHGGRPEP